MAPKNSNQEIPVTLNDLVLIGGNGHKSLAKDISSFLQVPLADAELTRFIDGEVSIKINENIRGKNVFIIQSCAAPVNENIMELLLSVSCARRAGANRVIAVIPYFGYKHHRRGSSLSTKNHSRFLTSGATDFAKMLQTMGVERVIAMDLQRPGQGHEACFFDNSVPTETVISTTHLIDYVRDHVNLSSSIVVVAPNSESVKRARLFQLGLQSKFGADHVKLAAFVIEQQASAVQRGSNLVHLFDVEDGVVTSRSSHRLLGNPKIDGADVVIVDDMVDTAGTLSVLSEQLVSAGARRIILVAAHGLFTEKSMEIIDGVERLERVIVTNSLPLPPFPSAKVHQISIASMLADVIRAEHFCSVQRVEVDHSFDQTDDA